MGDMADYYLEQEDPFERGDTYWPHDMPADNEGPPRQLRPQPTATVWVTREGERIPVVEMSDLHLTNTIRMLRRNVHIEMMKDVVALGSYLDGDPPDGAYGAALQAEDELLDMDEDDYLRESAPTYVAMLREAEKRGLRL